MSGAGTQSSGGGAGAGLPALFMDSLPADFQTNTQLAMVASLLDGTDEPVFVRWEENMREEGSDSHAS
jgi:hypothetical protein